MEHELVGKRGWVTKEEYVRGLAFSKLAPGPFATQLALYIGYIRSKTLGATLVGIAFILPSFTMVVGLAELYIHYGALPWISSAFYGISAAVLGIMVRSAYKLARTALGKKYILWIIFGLSAVTTALLEGEPIWMLIGAGVTNFFYVKRDSFTFSGKLRSFLPAYFPAALPMLSSSHSFMDLFLYFIQAGAVVFGSGLAIVPFLYGGVVQEHHWLTNQQFVDAVAVSMITPGPLVITVAFIGYLVSSFTGAIAAALGVFLPVYVFVVFLTPLYERIAKHTGVAAFIMGVTAATTGAIAGSLVNLGRHSLTDIPSISIAIITAIILFKFKIPEPIIVLVAACVGLMIR